MQQKYFHSKDIYIMTHAFSQKVLKVVFHFNITVERRTCVLPKVPKNSDEWTDSKLINSNLLLHTDTEVKSASRDNVVPMFEIFLLVHGFQSLLSQFHSLYRFSKHNKKIRKISLCLVIFIKCSLTPQHKFLIQSSPATLKPEIILVHFTHPTSTNH